MFQFLIGRLATLDIRPPLGEEWGFNSS